MATRSYRSDMVVPVRVFDLKKSSGRHCRIPSSSSQFRLFARIEELCQRDADVHQGYGFPIGGGQK